MNYQNYYRGKTILVTGGVGAIGSNLVALLSLLEVKKIIVLDNLSSSHQWNIPDRQNILFIKGDIRNDDDLKRTFHHRPEIVFHLAAFFANQNSIDYPLICESVNSMGLIKLLEYCVLTGNVNKFIYVNSEGGAYGDDCVVPYREDNISLRLSSPYYISKLSGESYCQYYFSQYNIPISIVRLFNSYGPGEIPGQYRNVIPNFIFWAMKKQPLPLTGNNRISRDFTFVGEIIEGIVRAGSHEKAVGLPINICSGKETLIYEMAEMINRMTNNQSGTRLLNKRKWDTREKIIGDNSRCREILQLEPGIKLEVGLEKTIKWFHDHWEKIQLSAEFSPGLNPALDVN